MCAHAHTSVHTCVCIKNSSPFHVIGRFKYIYAFLSIPHLSKILLLECSSVGSFNLQQFHEKSESESLRRKRNITLSTDILDHHYSLYTASLPVLVVHQPIKNKKSDSGRDLVNTMRYKPFSSQLRQWRLWVGRTYQGHMHS